MQAVFIKEAACRMFQSCFIRQRKIPLSTRQFLQLRERLSRKSSKCNQDLTIMTTRERNPQDEGNQNGHQVQAEEAESAHPEGGWGWVVCFTSMCGYGTIFANINTFGILYVAMVDQHGGADSGFQISWVGSICSGLTFLLSILTSILSDRFGIRKVSFIGGALAFAGMLSSSFVDNVLFYNLTYGLVMGTGFALVYSPSLVILGHYFKRRIGLVNGIVTFGSSVFTVAYALVLPILLKKIDLNYTLLCLCGMVFLLMPYALTWKSLTKQVSTFRNSTSEDSGIENANTSRQSHLLNLTIWHNRGYVVWVVATAIAFLGYYIPYTHLIQHTTDNFPDADGNLLVLCISVSSGVSRILFGLLADTKYVDCIRMEQAASFLLGVITSCLPFARSFDHLIVICLLMGVFDGLFICLLGPIAFDLVGESGASQALGFLLGIISIPRTLGSPIAGLCYDKLGSYTAAFHAAGVPMILGALVMFMIPRHKELSTPVESESAGESKKYEAIEIPDVFKVPEDRQENNEIIFTITAGA